MKSLLPPKAPFPPYTAETAPTVDDAVQRWGKRILLLVSLIGVLGAYANYSGWRRFGPDAAEHAIGEVRDSTRATSRRLDVVENEATAAAYVGCELLRINQPTAVPPQQCSPEKQRIRSSK